jgi:hypothetical protein
VQARYLWEDDEESKQKQGYESEEHEQQRDCIQAEVWWYGPGSDVPTSARTPRFELLFRLASAA